MKPAPTVLAADTNGRNLQLLGQFLGRAGFRITSVTNLDELDAALEHHKSNYDVALIDLSGFDQSVWDRCNQLHQQQIPWLGFCLSHQQQTAQKAGYRHGSRGIFVKPLKVLRLVVAVQGILESRS